MRIGIVEDCVSIREMLETGLKLGGNTVVVYQNAQDCIREILTARLNNTPLPHDIIVTDLDLGQGIDGAEMIRRLRQFITPEELPCVIMSGRDIVELNLLSLNLLDIRVMQKPVTPSGLIKEMKRILGAAGTAH